MRQGLGEGSLETVTDILEEGISGVFQTLGDPDCHSYKYFLKEEYFTSLTVLDVT